MALAVTLVSPVHAQETKEAPAASSPPPDQDGLVFRDERPLAIDAAHTTRVARLCNGSGDSATDLEVTATGFGFHLTPKGEQVPAPVEDEKTVLGVSGLPKKLAPGECQDLTVARQAQGPIDDGTYTGVLTVTAAGAGIARLPVTVAEAPAVTAAAGAAETATLRGAREGWEGDAELVDGSTLALELAGPGQKLDIGAECKAPEDGKPWDKTKCKLLGTLFNGPHRARLYVAGPVKLKEDVALLPVRVEGANHVGDYEGTLELSEGEEAKVKLSVKSRLRGAVAALVLGALIPFILQLVQGLLLPRIKLRERHSGLPTRYKAGETLECALGEIEEFRAPSRDKVSAYLTGVEKALKAYARSTLFFDTKSDAYQKIEKSLKTAEDDAGFLHSDDGFCKAMEKLKTKLEKLDKFLKKDYGIRRTPQVVFAGASLLRGKELEVGEATKRAKEAEKHAELLDTWSELARRTKRFDVWSLELAERAAATHTGEPMTEEDLERLRDARAKVIEVRDELVDAKDAEALSKVGTPGDVDALYDELMELGSRYGVPPPEDRNPADLVGEGRGVLLLDDGLGQPTHEVAAWIEGAKDAVVEAATPVAVFQTVRWLIQGVVLFVSLGIAVVVGLEEFYFDKPFGSFEDYLVLVAGGTAATAVSKALIEGLPRVWAGNAPAADVEKDPKAATVEAKA